MAPRRLVRLLRIKPGTRKRAAFALDQPGARRLGPMTGRLARPSRRLVLRWRNETLGCRRTMQSWPSKRTAMKSDLQLRTDIEAELAWEPSIDAAHVGVAVKDGVVTLTGHLETYAEKAQIERAVARVAGVRAVAVEADVKLASDHVRSDTELAEAVEFALKWNAQVPQDSVQVRVEKGWVTLKGECEWDYQRRAIEKAVKKLRGLRGVTSLLTLKARATPADVHERIRAALERHADRESSNIELAISGSSVTLRGIVASWAERYAAQAAAWAAPGISQVINELRVEG
jgi:osmotically-inducible protein OsmY